MGGRAQRCWIDCGTTVVTMTPDVGAGGALAIVVLACLLALAVRAATKDVRVRRTAQIGSVRTPR